MLIDCHTHAFADKIADRAVEQLIHYYNLSTTLGGRLSDLVNSASEADLDAIILLVAATRPQQLKPANDWILDLSKKNPLAIQSELGLSKLPKIVPFGAFHPDTPDWPKEINRLQAAGIKGIKLHPEFQGFDLADPGLLPFYEEVAGKFILMIHVGDPQVSPANYSTPRKVAAIIKNFPKSTIIAAHLGGYCFWEEVLTELAGKNVYLDTSSTLSYINQPLLRQIINKHGTDKILFGSDYPLLSPQIGLKQLSKIPWLSAAEKERISGENCRQLLDL